MRDEQPIEHILEIRDYRWSGTPGRPAGIFWLDGRSVMAEHDSAHEAELLQRGAILVGTLRFDRDPLESTMHGRRVERMHAARIAREMRVSTHN